MVLLPASWNFRCSTPHVFKVMSHVVQTIYRRGVDDGQSCEPLPLLLSIIKCCLNFNFIPKVQTMQKVCFHTANKPKHVSVWPWCRPPLLVGLNLCLLVRGTFHTFCVWRVKPKTAGGFHRFGSQDSPLGSDWITKDFRYLIFFKPLVNSTEAAGNFYLRLEM